jgi:hypothetical protein
MMPVDLVFRSFSRTRWITFGTNRGIYDADGNVTPGYSVDEVGNYVITPAVYSGMTVVTPAVLDTWWMTNLRLTDQREAEDEDTLYPGDTDDGFRFRRSKIARFVREQATPVTVGGYRAFQFGNGGNRIQLFDPRDISLAPQRTWLGDMGW